MIRIALIAHDACKPAMVDWVGRHFGVLSGISLVATGTTGTRIMAAYPLLSVDCVKSGPLGGDQQIGAQIADGLVSGMIFFIDPLSSMPHDVDVKALTRLAVLYDIAFACNTRTADAVIAELTTRISRHGGNSNQQPD